jgi:hypothetical protein
LSDLGSGMPPTGFQEVRHGLCTKWMPQENNGNVKVR